MPNPGHPPAYDGAIDVRLRNGHVRRNTFVKQWRWKQWPHGDDPGDIEHWQPSKGD